MHAGVRLENKTRRCWIKGEMYNRWLGPLPPFLFLGHTLNQSLRWKRSNRGLPLEQNRSDLKSDFDREGWGDAGVLSRPLQLSFQAREVLQRRTSADCQRNLSGLQRKTTWMDATKIPELHHNGFVWMQTRIKSVHPSHTVADRSTGMITRFEWHVKPLRAILYRRKSFRWWYLSLSIQLFRGVKNIDEHCKTAFLHAPRD